MGWRYLFDGSICIKLKPVYTYFPVVTCSPAHGYSVGIIEAVSGKPVQQIEAVWERICKRKTGRFALLLVCLELAFFWALLYLLVN